MRYRYRSKKDLQKLQWGSIPKTWKQSKAQYYFDVFAGGTPSTNEPTYWDGNIPWINSGEVQNCLVKNISRYITEKGLKESSTKLIPKNTVLLAMTGATCGNVGYLTFESTANQSVMAFVPRKNFISKFLYYYLMCQEDQIEHYKTGGAQGGINVDNGKKIYINIPSIIEQEKIANFLDEKTSQFDLIISKKEKLIERLEEAKKSLISEVVTGKVKVVKTDDGYELINRSSEDMKDSGVEWLGEVPKNWEVSKIKYECSINARIGWKALKADEYVEEGYIFLATPNIKGKYIDFENVNYITQERYDESPEIKLKINDVLLTKDGSTLGTVNVVRNLDKEATVNSSLAVIRPNKNLNGVFLNYFIKSSYMQSIIGMFKDGMGVPHLFQSDIKLFNILLPKYEEQLRIYKYLDREVDLIDSLINKTTIQIEKLKEAKQSLIGEAVTGKIEILD